MRGAIINQKTIIIWNNLSDKEAEKLLNLLSSIIKEYQKNLYKLPNNVGDLSVPIPIDYLKRDYLTITHINNNILVYTTKNINGGYSGIPIINGDELYQYIDNISAIYKNEISKKSTIFYKKHENYLHIKYDKHVEKFLLSPFPDPKDFIDGLKTGNLPKHYINFLNDINVSLNNNPRQININNNDFGLY